MNLKSIEYFLITVEEMNFTRAAEACHVTQPALSRAIRAQSHVERQLSDIDCLFHKLMILLSKRSG